MKRFSAGVIFLVLLAACGGVGESSVSVKPDKPQAVEGQGPVAEVGDSIKLSGFGKLRMQATVLQLVDPVHVGRFNKPKKGNRLVAIKIELANVGPKVYNDSVSNGAVLIDKQFQQYETSFIGSMEPDIGSPTIAPGDKRVGFLTFEIPERAQPRRLQLTLESGFGPEAGEWKLGKK